MSAESGGIARIGRDRVAGADLEAVGSPLRAFLEVPRGLGPTDSGGLQAVRWTPTLGAGRLPAFVEHRRLARRSLTGPFPRVRGASPGVSP